MIVLPIPPHQLAFRPSRLKEKKKTVDFKRDPSPAMVVVANSFFSPPRDFFSGSTRKTKLQSVLARCLVSSAALLLRLSDFLRLKTYYQELSFFSRAEKRFSSQKCLMLSDVDLKPDVS